MTSPSKLEDNVTSHTFSIEKNIIFNFAKNLLVGLKIILSAKIELIELYNIVVHYISIHWWVYLEKFKIQIFPIHFSYIFILTSLSTWISDRKLQSFSFRLLVTIHSLKPHPAWVIAINNNSRLPNDVMYRQGLSDRWGGGGPARTCPKVNVIATFSNITWIYFY